MTAIGSESDVILAVSGVTKVFARRSLADAIRRRDALRTFAVEDVTLSVRAGETLGIVGESGSGKTTLARMMVRLLSPDAGAITFRGEDVSQARGEDLRRLRRRVQLVYQDPYSSLNPALTVGAAIGEPALVHGLADRGSIDARVGELMEQVGLRANLRSRLPRDLSGGQRQRVAIARALAVEPELLVADEAVSALDVSIQAQVVGLLAELQRSLGLTLVFVSHQLATVSHLCERVVIMYRGRIVEAGPTAEVFARPRHGYTAALMAAHPGRRPQSPIAAAEAAAEVPANDASSHDDVGCPFRHKCRYRVERCAVETPAEVSIGRDHVSRCFVLPGMAELDDMSA